MLVQLSNVCFLLTLCIAAAASSVKVMPSKWESIGLLRLDRQHHKARYIGNGKVIVVGGYTLSTAILVGQRTTTCEIMRTRTRSVWPAASMAVERGIVDVVTADDGTLYVVGGDTDNGLTDLVERYDVNANRCEIVGRLQKGRWQYVTAFICSTEILVVAGYDESSAEIFDV